MDIAQTRTHARTETHSPNHDDAPAATAAPAAAGPDFASLGLCRPVLDALDHEGYTIPTPIQAQAIPPIIAGRDMLGCAQTGTGKTAAFALPIIHRLLSMPADPTRRGPATPRALILAPTRELAAQIGESFAAYGRHAGLSYTTVYGGVSQFHQVRALQRGVDILLATPGRLTDLMQQRVVDLSRVGIFVLDEADRMLDMGFIQPIRRIAGVLPTPRQTLLFSATMPREIVHLADALLKEPARVSVAPVSSTAERIEQSLYMVHTRRKQMLLTHLVNAGGVKRAVVFTKTKHGADRVCRDLVRDGISAVAIHGNKAQNYRQRALDAFRSGRTRILVATDVAARGLDVDGITHVFNYDLPMEPEAYVHRIGRTARAGAAGVAISFCDAGERVLLRDVQRLLKTQLRVVEPPAEIRERLNAPIEPHAPARPQHPHATIQPRSSGHHAPRNDRPTDERPARKPTRPAHTGDPAHGTHAHPRPAARPAGPGPARAPHPLAKPAARKPEARQDKPLPARPARTAPPRRPSWDW